MEGRSHSASLDNVEAQVRLCPLFDQLRLSLYFVLTDRVPSLSRRIMQRKMLVRLARKQQNRIQTKALLVWKLVLIARGLFEHQQKQINARLPDARAQQHLLRSLAARMQVHVEATLRLLGAFGFLPR